MKWIETHYRAIMLASMGAELLLLLILVLLEWHMSMTSW